MGSYGATPPAPLPSPLPHPPPPPRPPATTPQPMGEQQAPHLTRAMADERWRTVSWRMNKNLCLRRPVSEPGPLRMRDCRADHWTTETSCAWRRDMAVRAARGARRYRRSARKSCDSQQDLVVVASRLELNPPASREERITRYVTDRSADCRSN
ncbi:hypothetical protein J6590_074457 [Homalodisca vitripennis]|nr:hypothetical protein J6590_074457 [Homalodisca vitripennis]